jgi:hypothetical protein
MAFDFPASPAVGQLYPASVAAGMPQYKWDGQTWVATGSVSNYVKTTGDTMTGPLVLNADPAAPLGAATKQYADSKVNKAGDTMTGPLVLNADPAAPLGAATKKYVDGKPSSDPSKLPLAGGTMTGAIQTANSGGAIGGPNPSTAMVVHGLGGTAAYVTFLCDGSFGGHFGLYPDGNFYIGGFSYGAANYKMLTTRDGSMVTNVRLVFVGDVGIPAEGMSEPYGGAVLTGFGFQSGAGYIMRLRYLQILLGGAWGIVGYA